MYRHIYRLLMVLFLLLLCTTSVQAEDPWSFVVIPDALNNDVALSDPDWFGDNPDGSFNDGTYAALPYVLDSIAAESSDFVLVPGDLVQGRWSLDAFTDAEIQQKINSGDSAFSHLAGLSGVEARKAHIRYMADQYYPDWNQMWADHGISNVHTIPGDHEMGDDDWDKSYDSELIPIYREKYEEYRSAPIDSTVLSGSGGRTFSWTYKNLTLVGVDVFETDENGDMDIDVSGDQLDFVDAALENSTSIHNVVMGHTPILPGSLKQSSSGLVLPGGSSSDLWQTMVSNNVDLYFAGEVHDISFQEKDGTLQVVTGSQPSNVSNFNYTVVTVYDDRLELEFKLLATTLEGPRDFTLDPYEIDPYLERQVKLTQAQYDTGFQTVGTLVVDKSTGQRQFIQKTGYCSTRYTVLSPSYISGGTIIESAFVTGTDLTYNIDTSGFDETTPIYIDREYTWTAAVEGGDLPECLIGADYLQTANDDKGNEDLCIEVDLAKACMMYIIHDDRIINKPTWLTTQFSDTGENVVVLNGGERGATFSVWKLFVDHASSIEVGENGTGSDSHYGQYTIAAAELIPGDANADGQVDGSDATILASYWQQGVGNPDPATYTWSMGDFNGDGQIDGSDATILASYWQTGINPTTAVPEPTSIMLLATLLLAAGLIRRT